jgi:hypothetical protein
MVKIKVVYIASNGRSGSTLLEILLGRHHKGFAIGEFHLLPFDFNNNNQPCGCGESVSNCDFWKKVVSDDIDIINHPLFTLFREKYGKGKILRFNYIKSIFLKCEYFKICAKAKNDMYVNLNYQLFKSVLKHASTLKNKPSFIIDSSKDLYRLLLLSCSDKIDLRVVHLTKSPEAYVFGAIKKTTGLRKSVLTIRMSIRWIVENYLINKVGKISKVSYCHLKYDNLVSDPHRSLRKISEFIGENYDENMLSNCESKAQHGIAGNLIRLKNGSIKHDKSWIVLMPLVKKIIVRVICYPLKRYFKY